MVERRLGAIPALGAALLVSACGASGEASPGTRNWTNMCVAALVNVQQDGHVLDRAEVVPGVYKVIQDGPPPRVQCGLAQGTYIGAVTFDAVCTDWQSPGCARVTAAIMDSKVVYESAAVRSLLRRAAARPQRRGHQG